MSFVSRGFRGRRRESDADATRLPPGQYLTDDFPVLSAGLTPHTPLDRWDFSIVGEVDEPRRWTWDELRALPSEEVTVDIHCVTKWSKLNTVWTAVSVDTLLEGISTSAEYVTARSDGGYTTNLPLEDVSDGKAWIAFEYDDEPLEPEHGGPARLLVPHLYFWKSERSANQPGDAEDALEITHPDPPCRQGVHALFHADQGNRLETIVLNCYVDTTDTATGSQRGRSSSTTGPAAGED